MEIHGLLGSNVNNYHHFQQAFCHAEGGSCKTNICITLEREDNA